MFDSFSQCLWNGELVHSYFSMAGLVQPRNADAGHPTPRLQAQVGVSSHFACLVARLVGGYWLLG